MEAFESIQRGVIYVVQALIVAVACLMLLRLIWDYADLNPFGRLAFNLRRLTDPLVAPVKRVLTGFGIGPKVAPVLVILLAVLLGWFIVQLTGSILGAAAGMVRSARAGNAVRTFGFLLYGLLDVYGILLFIRIIFSWGMVSYANPVMRFLVNVTDPLLLPLRRMIPPLGMLDISPLVAFILIWLFKSAIAGTLL